MVDASIADRLLGLLQTYVTDLQPLAALSVQEYRSDLRTRRFAERTLQIAVEACLDLGHHVIADEGFREPASSRDVFAVLAEHGILPDDLLPRLQDMASFRNLVVHNYGGIDDALVLGILKRRLPDFLAFAAAFRAHLARAGA